MKRNGTVGLELAPEMHALVAEEAMLDGKALVLGDGSAIASVHLGLRLRASDPVRVRRVDAAVTLAGRALVSFGCAVAPVQDDVLRCFLVDLNFGEPLVRLRDAGAFSISLVPCTHDHAVRGSRLLQGVREFMRQQAPALLAARGVLAGSENDVVAHGVGAGAQCAGGFGGERAGVNAHAAEIVTSCGAS